MKTNDVILKSLSIIISGCIFLLPINYVYVAALGLLFSVGTAFSGIVAGKNFFKHHFTHIHVPLMGEMELHTAAIFDLGVYLIVVGVLMSVILAFGKDGK